jgi:hypothetical protein
VGGPIRRAFQKTGRALKDNFIGYPQEFVEPPMGFTLSETFGTMKGKANIHRFTLYRSDFLDGSDKLSPGGATRFNIMASRVTGWLGPIVIEWSPDEPGLAESRRAAVAALFQASNLPVIPDRVVIGPSPYPGLLGTDAANNYNVLIIRDQQAPSTYTVTPVSGGGLTTSGGGTP